MTMKEATLVKDPVCGMDVDTATAAGHSVHKGQTYYFCSSTWRTKFELRPEQYVSAPGKSQH
jgi:YHS domain-containing protein